MRLKALQLPEPPVRPSLTKGDAWSALGICAWVFASTFPVVVPFLFIAEVKLALRLSNAVAIAMLFLCGIVLARSTGLPPWRTGLVDHAIGVAGLGALRGHIGDVDAYGNELGMTEIAEADELAAAAELVKGKLTGVPVAVVRGYAPGPATVGGIRALLRPAAEDMFRLGSAEARREAVTARRTVREFTDAPVDPASRTRYTSATRYAAITLVQSTLRTFGITLRSGSTSQLLN